MGIEPINPGQDRRSKDGCTTIVRTLHQSLCRRIGRIERMGIPLSIPSIYSASTLQSDEQTPVALFAMYRIQWEMERDSICTNELDQSRIELPALGGLNHRYGGSLRGREVCPHSTLASLSRWSRSLPTHRGKSVGSAPLNSDQKYCLLVTTASW